VDEESKGKEKSKRRGGAVETRGRVGVIHPLPKYVQWSLRVVSEA